ncbi:MAG: hypothetical protein GF392_05320, partial [Candidatus Omnitrophica bacterium]|nr:hypothetical protein [Candidatus Omnitrophota bacterium]
MSNKPFNKLIRIISGVLVFTVLWQNIATAAPGVFNRSDILPRTLCFNTTDKKGDFSSAMAGYISGFLSRAASVPGNRNLSDLRRLLSGELSRLTGSSEIPAELKSRIPAVSGSPEEGELLLDLDGCVIRLYNHRMLDDDPGFPCQVLQQRCLGEYLTLQKLSSLNAPSGMIARGEAAELFNLLKPPVNLSPEQLRMLRTSYKAVKKRVRKAGLDRDTLQTIQDIFKQMPPKKMPEILKRFEPVVLLEEDDRTNPDGWLIGFNTLPEKAAE